jgi:hypothetical protein
MGMGALGLATLLGEGGLIAPAHADTAELHPLAPKAPHFPAKAKHVIHIFLNGGPSHVDTFDPKPALTQYAGKAIPSGNLQTERKTGAAFPSPFGFRRHGQSGLEISDIFSELGGCADDLCIVRSMQADLPNHEPSLMLMNCGDAVMVRPSMGSWLSYGLGTENQNLPSFIALCPGGYPIKESENWRAAFLPGVHQGTFIDTQHTDIDKLIENIRNRVASPKEQRQQLDLIQQLNAEHRKTRQSEAALDARIQSFELAYRMQTEATDAFDISKEPQAVRDAYGEGVHARQMLIARRLVERGVRMVQVWHGAGQPWDNHDDIMEHKKLAAQIDKPVAALIKDLKQRGLLDSTLIMFGGEFGRTPAVELTSKAQGRDHNNYGFSMVLAGGGIRGGMAYGKTDEFGFKAQENIVHVHDLHATLLHCLGFDHTRLTYRYAGRDFRLTDVHGSVVKDLLA